MLATRPRHCRGVWFRYFDVPPVLRFRHWDRGSRFGVLCSRVYGAGDVGRRRALRAALLLLELPCLSRIFLLAFGLAVVLLVQETSDIVSS